MRHVLRHSNRGTATTFTRSVEPALDALMVRVRDCCELLAGTPATLIRHVEFSTVLPRWTESRLGCWAMDARRLAASYRLACRVELRGRHVLVHLARGTNTP